VLELHEFGVAAASKAPKGPAAEFVVRRDNAVIDSRIIIPRALLPAGKNSGDTPDARPTGMRQQNAILAGLLLAIVIAGGGLIVTFARRRKPRAAAATLVVVFTITTVVSTAMGEPILPSPFQSGQPLLQIRKTGTANIVLKDPNAPKATMEIVETGDSIIVILGRNAPQFGH
jgi:hypothetical protein